MWVATPTSRHISSKSTLTNPLKHTHIHTDRQHHLTAQNPSPSTYTTKRHAIQKQRKHVEKMNKNSKVWSPSSMPKERQGEKYDFLLEKWCAPTPSRASQPSAIVHRSPPYHASPPLFNPFRGREVSKHFLSHYCRIRSILRHVRGLQWLSVAPHVLRTLEGAPKSIAKSEKLSEVNVVVSMMHL